MAAPPNLAVNPAAIQQDVEERRTLRDFTMPVVNQNTLSITVLAKNFEIKPAIIQMIFTTVQSGGYPDDDPNFREVCDTFRINEGPALHVRWSYPLFCLQLLLLHSLTLSKLCSHDQVYALLQFKQLFTYYNDTPPYNVCGSRPTHQYMEHWKGDTDCCSWDGVTCDDMDTGHVTELDLSCNQLNGTIPSNTTLFLLPYLQFLDLSGNNHLKGSFPEANWNNPLKSLDVSYTSFSGRLPNSIDNLKFLMELNLQHCKFIELVPASIGNLTHLEYLDLSHNNFSGNIPSSLSNLQNLSSLDLSVNNFIGEIPEIFVNLTQLDSLDLSSNQLSGTNRVEWSERQLSEKSLCLCV
ncbi:hypothetical protein EZV62_018725 [Acer yangbiense]|uniref:Leucine-rich repeat-containing N-terminal plant-type domain-containing protein n=1 Tax=Acer yangbiense TaxID=1000413 RepID=A0A5C7HM40_9ROSI|nr:hypothetical protein EZV62_018725 [Acer yangbiense]